MNLAGTRIDVLIADRDHMAGQLMATALRPCRSQFDVVVVTTNSGEAIGSLNIYKPHVALVSPDLEDGSQSGFRVLQMLRAKSSGNRWDYDASLHYCETLSLLRFAPELAGFFAEPTPSKRCQGASARCSREKSGPAPRNSNTFWMRSLA
jgi:hypothetical protein